MKITQAFVDTIVHTSSKLMPNNNCTHADEAICVKNSIFGFLSLNQQ